MNTRTPTRPFPVRWMIDYRVLRELDPGSFVPRVSGPGSSTKDDFVFRVVSERLPTVGQVVMVQITLDTRQAYSRKNAENAIAPTHRGVRNQRRIVRVWPITTPREREYPTLHLVAGATRITGRGASSHLDITGGTVLAEGHTWSATSRHGFHHALVLVKANDLVEAVYDTVSNSGVTLQTRVPIQSISIDIKE